MSRHEREKEFKNCFFDTHKTLMQILPVSFQGHIYAPTIKDTKEYRKIEYTTSEMPVSRKYVVYIGWDEISCQK